MLTRSVRLRILYLLFTILILHSTLRGADVDSPTAGPAKEASESPDVTASQTASPRAAMKTFIEGMNRHGRKEKGGLDDAMRTLDLSQMDSVIRKTKGPELAFTLKEVIDRTALIDYSEISNEPDAEPHVIPVEVEGRRIGQIAIARMDSGDWKFTSATLDNIYDLFGATASVEKIKGVVVQDELPVGLRLRLWVSLNAPFLQEKHFYLETWQWIGVFLVIFVGLAIGRVAMAIATGFLARWMRSRGTELPPEVGVGVGKPLSYAITAGVWGMGLNILSLPQRAGAILLPTAQFIAAVAIVWTIYRLVDVLGQLMRARAEKSESTFDDLLVPIVTRSLKIFVIVAGLIQIAQIFDWKVNQIIAGLGLGGLAFALAAKDTISNIFGSLTVLLDKPFKLGDWVVFGGAEGTVESVGIRSTRIRTFYNSLITVPNSELINATVDNYGAREYRRISCKLGITYDTPPEKIEAFCEGIRELIRAHPYTRKDYYHVWLNEFADSSLNVLLYCFHKTPEWATELRERHRLFLDIIRLAQDLGVEFAFPTQTLHMNQAPPLSDEPDSVARALLQENRDPLTMGRNEARRIAEQSYDPATGLPTPVSFNQPPDDDVNKKVGGDEEGG